MKYGQKEMDMADAIQAPGEDGMVYGKANEATPAVFDIDPVTTQFGFEWALTYLKEGLKVARTGWNGKSMWINLQTPDEHSKMSLPYIYMYTAQEDQVPWLASQTDLLANDWVIIED